MNRNVRRKSDKNYLIFKVQKFYDTYEIIPEPEHLDITKYDLKTYKFTSWKEVLIEAGLIDN